MEVWVCVGAADEIDLVTRREADVEVGRGAVED